MKLSTAIFKGCKMKPVQCFNGWSDASDSACVMAAAFYAIGWFGRAGVFSRLFEGATDDIMNDLTRANDSRFFSREFLAHCLEAKGL